MPNNFIAAVDMGTNSFHLIIAKIKKDGTFKIVDKAREVIRLGSQKGKNLSIISPQEIEIATGVLKQFKKLCSVYETDIRAVATSAVREAENKDEFINYVYKNTSIKVEVIEGHHEAELIYLGAKKALPLSDKRVLCVDIGGGSTEFIFGNKGKPEFAESVKIGAVRLSKMFFPDFILNDKSISDCENYIETQIKSVIKLNLISEIDFSVGCSGTIQSVASMIHFAKYFKMPELLNGLVFSSDELDVIFKEIMKKKTTEERLSIKGLEAKRADIIPTGLIILKKIFDLFNIKRMMVSEYALREGIILEMIAKENDYI